MLGHELSSYARTKKWGHSAFFDEKKMEKSRMSPFWDLVDGVVVLVENQVFHARVSRFLAGLAE